MECDKDEAGRAKSIAERKLEQKDYVGAKKFSLKAQSLYSGLEGVSQMLTTLDVHISAENKISGEVDWYGVLNVDPSAEVPKKPAPAQPHERSKQGKSSGLNSFGLMWCNGIFCTPILLIWTFFRGELEMTMKFQYVLSPGFLVVLLLSCIWAFLLDYTIFLNTTLNSAPTQTICGNLKDLFTIILGWMIFGGLPFDLLNVIGQLFGFIGSGMYAYYKLFGQ